MLAPHDAEFAIALTTMLTPPMRLFSLLQKDWWRRTLGNMLGIAPEDTPLQEWHLVVKVREGVSFAILTNVTTAEVYRSQGPTPAAAVEALRADHGIDPKLVAPVVRMTRR